MYILLLPAMLFQFYTGFQQILLIAAIVALLLSLIVFHSGRIKASLALLFIGSLLTGTFAAILDPFLNLWDEQFHALVAKNICNHPFKPMLYANPVIGYTYTDWTANHIWVHKQPLYLWQIALSLKMFGWNAFAVRIPDVIMHAILPLLIFRIGKTTINNSTGFYAAIFFSLAYYPLELLAGKFATDHNDVAFLFYVTLSFFGWFEYMHSKNKYWLVVIGLSSGAAVLVKWIMGLLVFIGWGISLLASKERLQIKNYLPLLKSICISVLVFIPWQMYTLIEFPKETKYEFSIVGWNRDEFRNGVDAMGFA